MLCGSSDRSGAADLLGLLLGNQLQKGQEKNCFNIKLWNIFIPVWHFSNIKGTIMYTSFSISVYCNKSILGALKDISESSCLIEQDYWHEASTVQRIKSFSVKGGCQWQVISQRAALASSCLPHYSAHIHHLQNAIIPLKTPLQRSVKDAPVCTLEPERKWLSVHRCVIAESCLPLFLKRQNFQLFLSPYVSEHKMKMRGPLSGDNFPWVRPIECYSSVSNLSGKVLERYSRMLDAGV